MQRKHKSTQDPETDITLDHPPAEIRTYFLVTKECIKLQFEPLLSKMFRRGFEIPSDIKNCLTSSLNDARLQQGLCVCARKRAPLFCRGSRFRPASSTRKAMTGVPGSLGLNPRSIPKSASAGKITPCTAPCNQTDFTRQGFLKKDIYSWPFAVNSPDRAVPISQPGVGQAG